METVKVKLDNGKRIEVGLVQEQYFMGKVKGNPLYVPVYDDRYQRVIAENIKIRVANKFDCIILCTGKRRTGKTTQACQCARIIDPEFPVRHVTFELDGPKGFNTVLAQNPYADPEAGVWPQVILDEAGFDLFSQNWMERVQKNIVKKFEVIGIKNQIVWLVLPHRKKLNKSIREEMVQYWIHTTVLDGQRGIAELRIGMENIYEEEMYWRPEACFLFEPLDGDPWWDEGYLVNKREFVDRVAADETGDEPDRRGGKTIAQRNLAIKTMYQTTPRSHSDIARELGIPLGTVSWILKGISKRS